LVCVTVLLLVGSFRGAPHTASTPTMDPIAPVPGFLPPGATFCPVIYPEVETPFNSGAKGTALTTCPFVEEVRRAYKKQALPSSMANPIHVASPVTRKAYDLMCVTEGTYVTCTGGEDAVIYLYNVYNK
jgi:serine/threonine kinase PknH